MNPTQPQPPQPPQSANPQAPGGMPSWPAPAVPQPAVVQQTAYQPMGQSGYGPAPTAYAPAVPPAPQAAPYTPPGYTVAATSAPAAVTQPQYQPQQAQPVATIATQYQLPRASAIPPVTPPVGQQYNQPAVAQPAWPATQAPTATVQQQAPAIQYGAPAPRSPQRAIPTANAAYQQSPYAYAPVAPTPQTAPDMGWLRAPAVVSPAAPQSVVQPPAVASPASWIRSMPSPLPIDTSKLFQSRYAQFRRPIFNRTAGPQAANTAPTRLNWLKDALTSSFKPAWAKAAAGAAVIAVVLLAVHAYQVQHSPQHMLAAALAQSLKTDSLTETVQAPNGITAQLAADTSDVHAVKALETITTNNATTGQTMVSLYTHASDVYVKYNQAGTMTPQLASAGLLGKWVQVQKDGHTTNSTLNVSQVSAQQGGYRNAVLGVMVTGNFSSKERNEIMKYLQKNNVYQLTSNKPAAVTVNERKALRYDVRLDPNKLATLNQKVITLTGVKVSVADLNLGAYTTAKIYVDVATGRVTQLELPQANGTVTMHYSGFGSSDPGEVPNAEVGLEQVQSPTGAGTVGGAPATTGTTVPSVPAPVTAPGVASQISKAQADDVERQTDIDTLYGALENFYTDNGAYPTLSDFNDMNWRQYNFPDINSGAFQDPASSSGQLATESGPGIYGYAVTDCQEDGCDAFTLSATLSNGTRYTKGLNT